MPLRLLDGKSLAFRARASFSTEASSKIEAPGCLVTGDEKALEESNEKAAGLVCNHGSG
jgi:hypothetical protein